MINFSCINAYTTVVCICNCNNWAEYYCIVSLFGGDVCSEKKSSGGVIKGKWKVTITRLGQYDKKTKQTSFFFSQIEK